MNFSLCSWAWRLDSFWALLRGIGRKAGPVYRGIMRVNPFVSEA